MCCSQKPARSQQQPAGLAQEYWWQYCSRVLVLLYCDSSLTNQRTMLRLPVFDTAPTMTFSPLERKSLQRRPIVRVLPQPGGPLIKVSPFLPHFIIAQFWRSLKSFWQSNISCLLRSITTASASPLKYLMICQLQVNSCIWYSLLSTEYRPLQAFIVGLTRARQQLQPLRTPDHARCRSDDTWILPASAVLGRQSSEGLKRKIQSPCASHSSSENLLGESSSMTLFQKAGSKSKCCGSGQHALRKVTIAPQRWISFTRSALSRRKVRMSYYCDFMAKLQSDYQSKEMKMDTVTTQLKV